MRLKSFAVMALLLSLPPSQVFACAVCYGAPGSKATESMAMAIWFLMAAVMSVLGGVGAFGFHLWKHSRMPLEPHQELTQEDLQQYD